MAMTNDIIRTPGKFEGEPTWVPHLWDLAGDGGADEDFGRVVFFRTDDELRAQFPGLAGVFGVGLEETEQGFVNSQTFDDEASFNAAIEAASENDDFDAFDDPADEPIEL